MQSKWLALSLWLSLSGCLPFHNQAATAEYDRRVVVASMRVAQLEEALVSTEARLAQAETWISARGAQESRQLENLEQVNEAVRQMRGDLELLHHGIASLQQEIGRLQVDNERRLLHAERRLSQIEQFLGVKAPPPPSDLELGVATSESAGEDPAAPVGGAEAQPAEEDELPQGVEGYLELGVGHMEGGRQGVARAVFEKAIAGFPGAPRLDEVRYRVGETWMNDGKWQKAAIAFQSVLDNHRDSDWAPWAMYRQGECFRSLGDEGAGRLFFEELIRLYPRSDAAKEAKKAL